MIYIFSNAHTPNETNEEYGKKLEKNFKVTKDDKIIFLNTMIPYFCNRDFFNQFQLYTLHRGYIVCDYIFYWGFELLFRNRSFFKKTFLIDHDFPISCVNVHQMFTDFKTEKDFIFKDKRIEKYEGNKSPTTGYLSYLLFPKIFDDEATLVNFYGSSNNTTEKNVCHNWDFEDTYFKQNFIKKLFI